MGGRLRLALLCDAFEAVMGALYLDAGLEAVDPIHVAALRTLGAGRPGR